LRFHSQEFAPLRVATAAVCTCRLSRSSRTSSAPAPLPCPSHRLAAQEMSRGERRATAAETV
jgi:hypothetical protein